VEKKVVTDITAFLAVEDAIHSMPRLKAVELTD
jgi:hypothetical protein